MRGRVRNALWAAPAGFIVFLAGVAVFVLDPGRSFPGVIAPGIPPGLVVAGVFALLVAPAGMRYAPP